MPAKDKKGTGGGNYINVIETVYCLASKFVEEIKKNSSEKSFVMCPDLWLGKSSFFISHVK